MNELLLAFAKALCTWLETRLPALGSNWWNDHVVDRLTFQQQRSVQEQCIGSLSELDLAALLRTLDQNWHEIAAKEPLPKGARNWLKELQTARNRWAHAPSGGLSADDAYRDADTLARLLEAIDAPSHLRDEVSAFKVAALARLSLTREQTGPQQSLVSTASAQPSASASVAVLKFTVGQLVCLKSNPNSVFPVLEVLPTSGGETRIRVFENGSKQVYYESQLGALEDGAGAERKVLSTTDLSALLSAFHLSSPSASALYSLNSGRIQFVPYQYRPVFKLIRADRPRLLVADEVGVGKTVEAGLILKELQARNDIRSVLVICPKALVAERKWELEMKRFDERFTALDGDLLRHCVRETHLSGEWPVQYEKAILPFSMFNNELLFGKPGRGKTRDMGLLELDPPPKFDLVIVDEAHHIRNSDTFLHQAVRYFCDNAEAVLFLSATPVQLGREDLFTLLNVLRPDVVIDPASFGQMAEPNRFINEGIQACRHGEADWADHVRAALREVAHTSWGRNVLSVNPGFQHIYDTLAEPTVDGSARIRTIQALEDLYTFSSLINRTRRRDIGEFTMRKPETVVTEFTSGQQALHDDLLGVIARILARLHGNQNVKFMMTTVSRQAASSLYGLAPMLESMLERKLDVLETAEATDDDSPASYDFLDEIGTEIRTLLERAKQLDDADPKAEAFLNVVSDKVQMPKNKVLVFSTFRHTLSYLVSKLQAQRLRFGLVHGGIADNERADLRRRFALPKDDEEALDVLLSSEVGCEGLDFQFCDCLVNYDLPWNPMRIEQRIGRIDRYGQLSETVAIFNFITPGTIDAEIYNRCLARIGVFHHAIGGSEEILGEITRELHSISDSFTLTEEERGQRLQQLADNKIRQIEEERKLEEQQGELFGLNLASASWEEKLRQSRNYWLEPSALASALSTYLSRRLGKQHEFLLGEKALKVLRLSQEARASLLDDFRKLPHSNEPIYRVWERWLKGTAPTLPVTFDQACAVENPSAVLLSLTHPLVRQAAHFLLEAESVFVQLRATHPTLPGGVYPFAIYRWARQGVRRDEELMAVSSEASIAADLFELLQAADSASDLSLPGDEMLDALDAIHHRQWVVAAAEHAEDNRQLVGVRIQSLTASYRARKALLEEQIARATNERIGVMKHAELERAQADFDRRIAELTVAADGGDIRATPAVFGVIEVRRPA
ncbi:helicase-related protein [Paraburkholderia graminis]|uniref:helicase-related protein n=1 Tax=Paraburkholderia graminis TaxID=60548 RepID=UPI0004A80933